MIKGQDIYVAASIGIATNTTDYDSPVEVMRDADLAMYRTKRLGKARCEVYDQAMQRWQ